MDIYKENCGDWYAKREAAEQQRWKKNEDDFVEDTMGSVAVAIKAAKNDKKKIEKIKEREQELRDRFARLMADDMLDLDEDWYQEELYNDEVTFITGSPESIFTKLENKNLERILEAQDTEHDYD